MDKVKEVIERLEADGLIKVKSDSVVTTTAKGDVRAAEIIAIGFDQWCIEHNMEMAYVNEEILDQFTANTLADYESAAGLLIAHALQELGTKSIRVTYLH